MPKDRQEVKNNRGYGVEKNRAANEALYTAGTSLLFSASQILRGSHGLLPVLATAEFLAQGHLLDDLPAVLFAVRPDGRRGELPFIITLQVSGHLEPSGGQLTHPALVWLHRLGTEACGLTVEE